MTATIDYLSPAEIEQMKFGSLDGVPILYSVNGSYALTATPRGKEWIAADQSAAGEATVLGERQFFKCFGSDLPPLPELMRKFDPRLWLVDKEGLVFSRFLKKKRPSHGSTTELCAPAAQVVVSFAERKAKRKRAEDGDADGDFYLGHHEYSAGPGFSWATEYRIRRQNDDGTLWEILSVDESADGYESDDLNGKSDHNRTFVSIGDFTTEQAKEYFDSVYFTISDEKWRAMGCHNLQCEEEQDCAICGERFEDSPFKVHKCRTD